MIIVFGTVCIDIIYKVPKLPQAGGYVEIESEFKTLGGEAANSASALQLWGDSIHLISNFLGNDESCFLIEQLSSLGLETHEITQDSNDTPRCHIYVTPDGDRTMFGKHFSSMDAKFSLPNIIVRPGDIFTADFNMPLASFQATQWAKEHGMIIYLMDFQPPLEILGIDDYWQSSTDMFGKRGDVTCNVEFVKKFVKEHQCNVILSDGPYGFVFGSPSRPVRSYPPYPSIETVDATGAGDLFRAGMIHGLAKGWEIERCLQFASASGCLSLRRLGGTNGAAREEEILDFISQDSSKPITEAIG